MADYARLSILTRIATLCLILNRSLSDAFILNDHPINSARHRINSNPRITSFPAKQLALSNSFQQKKARTQLYDQIYPSESGKSYFPRNEFSRPVRTEVILGQQRRVRSYSILVNADEEELLGLAHRFNVPAISFLESDLVLKKSSDTAGSGGGVCIEAEGSATATVTQTCVRTNENFEQNMSWEIKGIVRRFTSDRAESETLSDDERTNEELSAMVINKLENKKKKKKKERQRINQKEIGDLGTKFLQELMEDYNDDDIVEDENIYIDDFFDAGELVAQMFRLKLDPYPKKPGSEPIRLSISG